MGVRYKSVPVQWTEKLMQQKLQSYRSTARYVLQNLYVFGWESDILFLSRTGFWTEIEIKISRADFKADLKNKAGKHSALTDPSVMTKPNQFFYAVPEGLLTPEEIPEYAGLLTVGQRWQNARTVKPAPWLHRQKTSPENLGLTDKFYFNMLSAKREALEAQTVAQELTDAYNQGYSKARTDTVQAVLQVAAADCPYRSDGTDGRIRCAQLGIERYDICRQGLCSYLGDLEEKILQQFSR